MASFLKNIIDYLEDQAVGTVATDLVTGLLPADPDNCVAVLGSSGTNMPPNRYIGELEFPQFQVVIRNTSYELGDAKLRAVRDALHKQVALQLDDYFVLAMHSYSEGAPIGQDDKGRYEFSINFYAEIREESGGGGGGDELSGTPFGSWWGLTYP